MGNIKVIVAIVNAIAGAVASGTVAFAGLSTTAEKDVVAVAGLVAIGCGAYLATQVTPAAVKAAAAKMGWVGPA